MTSDGIKMVVIPDALGRAIDAALDKALAETPEASPDRPYFYNELLCFYDEHGYVPEFSLVQKEGKNA